MTRMHRMDFAILNLIGYWSRKSETRNCNFYRVAEISIVRLETGIACVQPAVLHVFRFCIEADLDASFRRTRREKQSVPELRIVDCLRPSLTLVFLFLFVRHFDASLRLCGPAFQIKEWRFRFREFFTITFCFL